MLVKFPIFPFLLSGTSRLPTLTPVYAYIIYFYLCFLIVMFCWNVILSIEIYFFFTFIIMQKFLFIQYLAALSLGAGLKEGLVAASPGRDSIFFSN